MDRIMDRIDIEFQLQQDFSEKYEKCFKKFS